MRIFKRLLKINTFMFKTKVFLYKSLSEGRLYEAEYFYTKSQSAKFTINFVKLTEKEQANEDQAASVREAVEKITNLGPDVILLYTSKEKMERLLNQQVTLIVFPPPPPSSSSFHLFLPILFDDTSFYTKAPQLY